MENSQNAKNGGRKTCFMAVIWWKYKKDGSLYSPQEISEGKNRKQHDSFDFTKSFADTVVLDERVGYNKLIKMTRDHLGKYYSGYIIAVRANEKICTWGHLGNISWKADPEFFYDEKLNTNKLVRTNPREAVRVDVKKQFIPQYSNINANKFGGQRLKEKLFNNPQNKHS